jgi:UDP-glucose 4-epimerase
MRGIDYVLHQAALGSVPRSIEDPITSNEVNVSGFLNVLEAAKEARVKKWCTPQVPAPMAITPDCPKWNTRSGNRFRLMQ